MTKDDVIWLLIRMCGLFFIWQGIESTITLIATLITMDTTPQLLPKSSGVIAQSVLFMMFYTGLGLYMISNGSYFHQVLSRQAGSDD